MRDVPVKNNRLLDLTDACCWMLHRWTWRLRGWIVVGCENRLLTKDSFHSDILPLLTHSDRGLLSRWERVTNRLMDGNSHVQAGRQHWNKKENRSLGAALTKEEKHDDCFIWQHLPKEEEQSKDSRVLWPAHRWIDKCAHTHTHTEENPMWRVIRLDSFLITAYWEVNMNQLWTRNVSAEQRKQRVAWS